MQLHCSNILTPEGSYLHYYCSHYLSASAGQDAISHSLVKFKQGIEPDLSNWIELATVSVAEALTILKANPRAEATSDAEAKSAAKSKQTAEAKQAAKAKPGLNGFLVPDLIVRALHHDEVLAATGSSYPLDRLGAALAGQLGASFRPELVQKHHPTPPLRTLKRLEREAQTLEAYYINPTSNLININVLLIDDVLTTGATASAIFHALTLAGANPIGVFTLAKAIPELNF